MYELNIAQIKYGLFKGDLRGGNLMQRKIYLESAILQYKATSGIRVICWNKHT